MVAATEVHGQQHGRTLSPHTANECGFPSELALPPLCLVYPAAQKCTGLNTSLTFPMIFKPGKGRGTLIGA
jgi:hypothetical protein